MKTFRRLAASGLSLALAAAAPGCGDDQASGSDPKRAGASGASGAGGKGGAGSGAASAAGKSASAGSPSTGGSPGGGSGGSPSGGQAGERAEDAGAAGDDAGRGGSAGSGGGAGEAGESGSGGEGGAGSSPIRDPRCDGASASMLQGSGSAGDPYLICLPEQLALLDSSTYPLDQSYALGDDVDVSLLEPPFTTIGLGTNELSGSFDGRSHEIAGLPATLIAIVADTGRITDVTVAGAADASALPIQWGLLTNTNHGTVRGAHATGTLTLGSHMGVLIGYNDGLIEGCSSSGSIASGGNHVGGLLGVNLGTVRQSFSTASVNATGRVGGLVGRQTSPGRIEESFALGEVTGTFAVGGLLGTLFGGAIVNSYARAATVSAPEAGGLVGDLNGATDDGIERTIASSYAASVLSGTGAEGLVGNLDGEPDYDVTDSYFLDTATGTIGVALSDSEMRLEANFDGWDFDDVWQLEPALSGYPTLRFQR